MTHTVAKLQPWSSVRSQVESLLKTLDPEDVTVMLPYGLQLVHSFCHPHVLRCMAFYHSTKGSTFVTHIDSGAGNVMYTWTVSSLDELRVHCEKFPIQAAITHLLSVPQHRVFVGFCSDMTLRVFSDVLHKCTELSRTAIPTSLLCMAYNEDTDELITGGHGCLQSWNMDRVELRDPLTPGRPIDCEIGPDDWVRDIRVFQKQRQLVALCNEGVFFVDYSTNQQLFHMQNWHATALTSFVWYRPLEYFITASMDGTIKVWNAIVFSQVHEFIGHYNCVTGLVTHPTDPLLISSSKDGTLRVWRLDTFQLTQRIDVGEEILGMTSAHGNQIYYYTLHNVRVWNFNQFHHLFTPIQSCIHKLARIKSMRMPSRILCAAEDGSVRLVSAVTGSVLTIVYPMATYQVHTDIVYDPLCRRIYTALNSGDVLVFDASTNPCYAKELWIPPITEESILCLALVKLDCAMGDTETAKCESLIFSGNNGGQISLLEARRSFMKDSVQGHGGAILALECSHGTLHGNADSGVGTADRLISSGSDKVSCPESPSHISMMSNTLCMALPTNNSILVFEIVKPGQRRGSLYGSSDGQEIKKYRHLKDHDHTKKISALCCCPLLGLFASSSGDGSVKVWDKTNTLIRELCFDPTLRGVCFANGHGDLLVGFQNHVSYVGATSYLPFPYLEKLSSMDFADEAMEEPLPFNPDHQLWFDIDDLPVFPASLVSRRRYMKKLSHYIQAYSSLMINTAPKLTSDANLSTSTGESILEESEDTVQDAPYSTVSEGGVADQKKSTKSLPIDEKLSVVPERNISHDSPVEAAQSRIPSPRSRSSDSDMTPGSSIASDDTFVWPIAPDGFIPNSALRALLGYHFSPPPPPPSPWALKKVPITEAIEEKPEAEHTYDHHEPFTWASSSEDSFKLESPIPDEEPVRESIHHVTPYTPVTPSEGGRRSVEDHKIKLRSFGSAIPKLIPIPTFEPAQAIDKSLSGRKGKRRGRGINVAGGTVRRRSRRLSQFPSSLEQGEEDSDETDSDESDEDGLALLRRLAEEKWFPPNVEMDVESVVRALLGLLETTRDAQYRTVCNAIIDIHREYGFPSKLTEDTLAFFDERLSSPRGAVRANAVRVMTELGADRTEVILKLIPKLVDEEEKVRTEAVTAVDVLAGIRTKEDLGGYLAKIGLFKPYQNEDAAVLRDLSQRYNTGPQPPTRRLRASLQAQMRAHQHHVAMWRNRQAEMEGQGIYGETSGHGLASWDPVRPTPRGETAPLGTSSDPQPGGQVRRGPRIVKKQRKRVDRPARPRPTARPTGGAVQGEESNSGEEGDASDGERGEHEEDSETDFDYQSEEMEDESRMVQFDAVSIQGSDGGLGQRMMMRRPTIHEGMLQERAAALAGEKDVLVRQMQEKLRRHREQYAKIMQGKSQRALQRKKILPVNPFYWRYYGNEKRSKAIRRSVAKLGSAPWIASSYASETSLDTELCTSLTSISHKYSTVRGGQEETVTPCLSEEGSKECEDATNMVMAVPSYKTTDSTAYQYQAESGFEESTILTSTVMLSDVTTAAGADGRTLGAYCGDSSGIYTDSFVGSMQIKGLRSKVGRTEPEYRAKRTSESPHSLTVANVRRHEHLSAKRGKQDSLRPESDIRRKLIKAETAIEEWRNFLREQGRRRPMEKVPQMGGPTGPVVLPRIPAGIPLAHQGGNHRLLYCISTGSERSKVKYPSHLGYFGSSDFGHMDMIWTNLSPSYHLNQPASTPSHPTVSLSSLELPSHPPLGGMTDKGRVKLLQAQDLRYSTPGRLDAIRSFDARTKSTRGRGPIYKWERPDTVLLPSIAPNLAQVQHTARWASNNLENKIEIPDRRRGRPTVVDPTCTPIVPRNSTISPSFLPQISPKLKTLC